MRENDPSRFTVLHTRLPRALFEHLHALAEDQGVSLNALILASLASHTGFQFEKPQRPKKRPGTTSTVVRGMTSTGRKSKSAGTKKR